MNHLGLESPTVDHNELYRVDHSQDVNDPYQYDHYQYTSEVYGSYSSSQDYFTFTPKETYPVDPDEAYKDEMMMSSICHYSDDDYPRGTQESFT
jgi:hypothetical protein